VVLPIGVNAVESVNCYVLPDGDRVTVVDCGVWRPDLPDGGLAALEAGLEGAGYALADVGRVVVTHAHIDHYGLAGRLMELTGAELAMHTMTDLALREVPPSRHRPAPAAATRTPTTASPRTSAATSRTISPGGCPTCTPSSRPHGGCAVGRTW
jgi:glyoxylase-like metal-dependent hydrolase (beta-lactamase superfamily II)